MSDYKLIIGSCVKVKKNSRYLLGALNETINNNANAMMIYTGSPQNKIRTDIDNFYIDEFHSELEKHNFLIENIVIHAPYIVNLANSLKKKVFDISVKSLKEEIFKANKIGISIIIVHPGNSVGASVKKGLDQIIKGLNLVLKSTKKVKIALESMSGKGTELGANFEQLKYIIDNVHIKYKDRLGICLDTCHLHDSGYNLNDNLNEIIDSFDKLIGLDKLLCIHVNDSKNKIGSHKDRHENVGYGYLGFNNLLKIVYHKKFDNKIKILETPYIKVNNNDNKIVKISPYKIEIEMIKSKIFINPFWKYKKIKDI